MEKYRLTEDDRAAIVNALTEKAENDDKRAAALKAEGANERLVFTFTHQAEKERALAEKIEGADKIESD